MKSLVNNSKIKIDFNVVMCLSIIAIFNSFVFAQQCPAIEFTYDNTGNRIQRQQILMVCSGFQNAKVVNNIESTQISADSLSVSVFPNPTQMILNIKIIDDRIPDGENKIIYLTDINGRVLYRTEINGKDGKINMHLYKGGNYFLTIVYANKKKTFQIIKID
ncbi:MAG: T9SS type A sorting domain-containing protein [Bacteroidia bacterium]|nr:T9SS type A sorting domain-containing protein [Bacteroidia bacterium]